MADCALEPVPTDGALFTLALRTIAVDAIMDLSGWALIGDWFVESSEAMAWMASLCTYDAFGAIVPVGTIQALVADTVDILLRSETASHKACFTYLIASVANGEMISVATWSTESESCDIEIRSRRNSIKGMFGVMAMIVGTMAVEAKIVIVAVDTCHKLGLMEHCYNQQSCNTQEADDIPPTQELQVRSRSGTLQVKAPGIAFSSAREDFLGAIVSVVLLMTLPSSTNRLIIQCSSFPQRLPFSTHSSQRSKSPASQMPQCQCALAIDLSQLLQQIVKPVHARGFRRHLPMGWARLTRRWS